MSVVDGFTIENFYRAKNRVFVGREHELRRMKAAVKDAVSGRGVTNQEIGYERSISPRTVATHIRHIFEKTGMTSRTACAAYAIQSGLVAAPGKSIRS